MFGLATSENEGETPPTRQQESEEPAPKGAKPKANGAYESAIFAKPEVDPLEAGAPSANKPHGFFTAGDKTLGFGGKHMKFASTGSRSKNNTSS